MYSGHVESDFVLQNSRCWQEVYNAALSPIKGLNCKYDV